MAERLAQVPRSLTGIWGELAVVFALRSARCSVEWDGGMTAGRDLRAVSPSGQTLHVQVKTSTAGDGRINWKKSGQTARDWGANAKSQGSTPLYVFVHFQILAGASVDLPTRTLTVQMPKDYIVTATTPEQFADDVDAARTEYGQRIRQRDDERYGKAGDPLSPDGLQYPVFAGQYGTLADAIEL